MKTMVEFFSGSSVLSREFELAGYDVFTVDNDASLSPALLCKELVSLCDGGLKSVQSLLSSPGPVDLDGDKMKNMIKLKDVGDHNKLYAFLTQELANDFCDDFDRPQDLVGVDVR